MGMSKQIPTDPVRGKGAKIKKAWKCQQNSGHNTQTCEVPTLDTELGEKEMGNYLMCIVFQFCKIKRLLADSAITFRI